MNTSNRSSTFPAFCNISLYLPYQLRRLLQERRRIHLSRCLASQQAVQRRLVHCLLQSMRQKRYSQLLVSTKKGNLSLR